MMLPDMLLPWLRLRLSLPMLYGIMRTVRVRFGCGQSVNSEDAHVARNDGVKSAICHGDAVWTHYMRSGDEPMIILREHSLVCGKYIKLFNSPNPVNSLMTKQL